MTSTDERPSLHDTLKHIKEILSRLEADADASNLQKTAFNNLYAELKQYKEDFIFQAEKPLLLDLLLFHDSLCWFRHTIAEHGEGPIPAELVTEAVEYLTEEFLEILARRDITPMAPRTEFDRTVHKAVKTLDHENPDMDMKVHSVLKKGFMRAGKLLRPEEVVIYKPLSG